MVGSDHAAFVLIGGTEMRQITESESTPKADGFYMPAEFAPQDRVFMGWPNRPDTFAFGAVPAQRTYAALRMPFPSSLPL